MGAARNCSQPITMRDRRCTAMVEWSNTSANDHHKSRRSNQGHSRAFQCGAEKWRLGGQESARRIETSSNVKHSLFLPVWEAKNPRGGLKPRSSPLPSTRPTRLGGQESARRIETSPPAQ